MAGKTFTTESERSPPHCFAIPPQAGRWAKNPAPAVKKVTHIEF